MFVPHVVIHQICEELVHGHGLVIRRIDLEVRVAKVGRPLELSKIIMIVCSHIVASKRRLTNIVVVFGVEIGRLRVMQVFCASLTTL